MAADGGCERDVVHKMDEGFRAWGTLKSVLSNTVLGIKALSVYVKEQLSKRRCMEKRHGV